MNIVPLTVRATWYMYIKGSGQVDITELFELSLCCLLFGTKLNMRL